MPPREAVPSRAPSPRTRRRGATAPRNHNPRVVGVESLLRPDRRGDRRDHHARAGILAARENSSLHCPEGQNALTLRVRWEDHRRMPDTMGLTGAVAAMLSLGRSDAVRRSAGEMSTETSILGSAVPSLDRLRPGDERLALALLFGIACGIPLFSRWRSHERS